MRRVVRHTTKGSHLSPIRLSELVPYMLAGAGTVLVFDLVASLLSRRFGWPYGRFAAGSFAIYAVTGSGAAAVGGWPAAALCGLVVALVEGTLGWYISWRLGPGRPPADQISPAYVSRAIAIVAITGALVGALGAVLSAGLARSA